MKLLDVNKFSVTFSIPEGEFQAVKSIDFHLSQGEILGLIGESGSGKSVTSQCLTRLISDAAISGDVIYHTLDKKYNLIDFSEKELIAIRRTEIAYIFQEPMTALNPLINCGKQILEVSEDKSQDYLYSLLHKVELTDVDRIANSYPHELSGGQRQRIMIAMALANRPKLLIADEPTTALDIAVQNEILKLLKKLCQEEKMGILFITHDLLSLKGFADRIAVMYHGKIVETSETGELMNSPKHAYTKALLESRATYAKRGSILPEIDDLLIENEKGLHFNSPKKVPLLEDKQSEEVVLTLDKVEKSHFTRKIFTTIENKVLHDISLKINQGDILGIVGESGSGKSTIAKIILNIWKSTEGQVMLHEKEVSTYRDLSEEIQLVFQDPFSSLNPKHKIGNAILEVLKSTDKKERNLASAWGGKVAANNTLKEKVVSLLQEVGLTASDFDKYSHEFSGGQRQRICIAKALAKNPKIIVLDEAVSALDVSVQAKVLNLLNDLKRKKGLTYLLISHDMNVVSYFCDKIVVLKDGRIVESGYTEKLIKSSSSDYTRSLMKHSTK